MQLTFLEPIDKSVSGATWFAGNWECRNRAGYYQTREGGEGFWQFVVYAFGDTDCLVYAVDRKGDLVHQRAPIDSNNRITIHGRKYGTRHWQH